MLTPESINEFVRAFRPVFWPRVIGFHKHDRRPGAALEPRAKSIVVKRLVLLMPGHADASDVAYELIAGKPADLIRLLAWRKREQPNLGWSLGSAIHRSEDGKTALVLMSRPRRAGD